MCSFSLSSFSDQVVSLGNEHGLPDLPPVSNEKFLASSEPSIGAPGESPAAVLPRRLHRRFATDSRREKESPNWRRWTRRLIPVVVALALFLVAPRLYDNLSFLTTMAIYAILAEGVNVIYGFTGYLPFGYVGFFGAGAYGASLAISYWHVSGILALLFGAVLSALIGLILSPLLRLSGAYFALATLAASQTLYYIVANESWTFGESGMSLRQVLTVDQIYTIAVVIVMVSVAIVVYIRDSHFGLSLRAIQSDRVSAAMAGVNVVRTRTLAWLISATLAGLAGALWAIMTSAFYAESPFDLTVSIYAIVFALFGGVRSVLGPIFGTVVLYSLYQYIGVSNPQQFELVYGLLIVVLVLFLPGGLSSIVSYARRRFVSHPFGRLGGRGDREINTPGNTGTAVSEGVPQ